MKKLILFFILLILIDISLAFTGSSDSYDFRGDEGATSIEQNSTSYGLRSFVDYLASTFNSTSYNSRSGILNSLPSIPILNTPIDTFIKSNTNLNWSNSTDLEGDPLTYSIEVSDNINFQYTNYSNSSIIETKNTTQEVSLNLTDDGVYYWRVKSFDGTDNSSFSEIENFTLDTILPTEFNLTSPKNGANATDPTPSLLWSETIESNFKEYLIQFSNETDFSLINFSFKNVNSVSNNSFGEWNETQVLSNGTWYWRVIAFDKAKNSNTSDIFVYTVGVVRRVVTQDVTITQESGQAKSRGPRRLQQIALDIIQPSPLSLFTNDSIITPIFITNKGDTTLRNINLKAITESINLDLQLTQENIGFLFPGQTIALDLIMRSNAETSISEHSITIEANVQDPRFKDSAKFFINILEFGFGERKTVTEKIEIINTLFDGNPDCVELKGLINQAEVELDKENYNKALSLVEAAIQGCKDLVASLGKELVTTPRRDTNIYISIIETIIALIFFMFIYRYYKKQRMIKKIKKN
tara:strand:+ start:120 stop:1697 length:1578 start_codon:yes stop_codon:yes gene_type:complete